MWTSKTDVRLYFFAFSLYLFFRIPTKQVLMELLGFRLLEFSVPLSSLRLHISPPSLTWYFYHFILSPYYSFNCGPPAAVHSVCVSLVPSCSPTFISTLWGHSFYSCLLVPESRVEQETESKHTFRLEVFIFVIPGHKPFQAPYFNIAT